MIRFHYLNYFVCRRAKIVNIVDHTLEFKMCVMRIMHVVAILFDLLKELAGDSF